MKKLIIILLLTPFAVAAQSKKELNAQLVKQIASNDSLEFALKDQKLMVDSLKTIIMFQVRQTKNLESNINEYRNSLAESLNEISRLEEELDNCMSKGKPAPPTNPNGIPTKPGNAYEPFGNGGSGSGTGQGKGNNFGKDNGRGDERYLIAKPNVSEIESEESCTIAFTVMINENGDVTGTPTVIKEKTTTTNMVLIKQVIQIVKTQAKYNVVKGSKVVKTSLTIQINAN